MLVQRFLAFAPAAALLFTPASSAEEKVAVQYYLALGNTALVERLMKGAPMELISVYQDAGDDLMMTHYCGLGNQPRCVATGFDDKGALQCGFHDASNMASPDELQMHGVTLTLVGDDELIHEWEHYDGGKKVGEVTVRLTRVK